MRCSAILALAVVIAWSGGAVAGEATARGDTTAVLPLEIAKPLDGQRTRLVVTMLAASGPPSSAVVSLRSAGSEPRVLGRMAPYPATFDTRVGDPGQQAEFDITAAVQAASAETAWTAEIKLATLSTAANATDAVQRFSVAVMKKP